MAAKVPATGPHHLARSHAHEDVPGTVDMRASEGDDTYYGLALYPVPSQDPNDPLQWPKWKKYMILFIVSAYSFLSNTALLGPSVYIEIYSEQFGLSTADASGLISYPNLAFGFGTLILIPLYHKIGRRPVMLISMVIYICGLIGASQSNTFSALMGCRVLHAFGSSVCEALPAQIVNDIFFLHERGWMLGFYTVALCLGSTGPLYAGYMLAGGNSWRLFFYVEFAFGIALLILAILFVEESMYFRAVPKRRVGATDDIEKIEEAEKNENINVSPDSSTHTPARKTFIQTLAPWGKIDHESEFFMMIPRAFTYFFVPPVFWVITTYGIYIGLGALVFNYTFPIIIVQPPYAWSQVNSGLICVATAVGFLLAVIPFNWASDYLAAYLTRRNNGIREAEFRLGVMIPACFIAPCGLILYGMAAQHQLHWFAYFAGVAMDQWGSYFYFTFTLAYAIDSYNANVSEMLIAMNLGKQSISFGFGFYILEWVLKSGYVIVISGIFVAVIFVNNLALFGFMYWGKSMRLWFADTWLARLHRRSIREVATH